MQYAKVLLSVVAAGAMLGASGCGKSKASQASNTPPQSLSQPVRAVEEEPASSPSIPVSNDDYAAQKPGQSRELPVFVAPKADPRTAAVTAAPAAPMTSDSGKVHMLAKGETLYAVARQYNVKPKDLIAANQFKDPNKLAVGTKVIIPN
jgi:LysM repeat protein